MSKEGWKDPSTAAKKFPVLLAVVPAILLIGSVIAGVIFFHNRKEEPIDANTDNTSLVALDSTTASNAPDETTGSDVKTTEFQQGSEQTSSSGSEEGTAADTSSNSTTGSSQSETKKTDTTAKSETKASQTTVTSSKLDTSGFAAKWPEKFLAGGDPVITDNSYKSKDINIKINNQESNGSVYYVADIYIRNIENLKSAFSVNRATGEEEYGENGGANYQEDGAKLSERVDSILTINGDYYSGRKTGIIFRNGQLYRNIPRAEVGAIYKDGTYKGFAKADFDVLAEQDKGLWQVMGFEPRLVENGKAIQDIKTLLSGMDVAAPRSGFGYYEPGHYCFVVADGRQEGYSIGPELQEWANFFETLGCEGAFNLDGGASSQMYFMGKLINRPTTGTSGGVVRMLPDVFYIGEKK